MPAVSSSLEKKPQNPPISLALRPETILHPDKRSKLENDAICGLGEGHGLGWLKGGAGRGSTALQANRHSQLLGRPRERPG